MSNCPSLCYHRTPTCRRVVLTHQHFFYMLSHDSHVLPLPSESCSPLLLLLSKDFSCHCISNFFSFIIVFHVVFLFFTVLCIFLCFFVVAFYLGFVSPCSYVVLSIKGDFLVNPQQYHPLNNHSTVIVAIFLLCPITICNRLVRPLKRPRSFMVPLESLMDPVSTICYCFCTAFIIWTLFLGCPPLYGCSIPCNSFPIIE